MDAKEAFELAKKNRKEMMENYLRPVMTNIEEAVAKGEFSLDIKSDIVNDKMISYLKELGYEYEATLSFYDIISWKK